MLEFTRLTLDDINEIRAYFPYSLNRICDNTVGGAFMWRDYFSVEYAVHDDTVIFKAQVTYHKNVTAFAPPLGKDFLGGVNKIIEYCRCHDLQIIFFNVTDEDAALLKTAFSGFQISKEEDWSDYLYHASDLVTLAGRKFSGQRNHINYFNKTHENYSFEAISKDNIADVMDFYLKFSDKMNKGSRIFAEEHSKTVEVLENYNAYGMLGGLLRVDGSVIAFSLGEVINDVLFIHVEKADLQYRGAYQVINNEFAKRFCSEGVKFVNREEDVGDEGLRISKKSYHPCQIIEKYIVVCAECCV